MHKSILVTASLLVFCAPTMAMTEDECANLWKQADTNGDGVLAVGEADRYAASMRIADKTVAPDGRIDPNAFMESCKADVFAARTTDEGAPLSGANSFTEGQAQDRVIAAGFSNISPMEKDDNGVWRGTATKDGKSVNVAVDFKGNVVVR